MLVQLKFEIKTLSTSISGTRQQKPDAFTWDIMPQREPNIWNNWIHCLVWWVTNVAIDLKLIDLNKLKSANKVNIASSYFNVFIR